MSRWLWFVMAVSSSSARRAAAIRDTCGAVADIAGRGSAAALGSAEVLGAGHPAQQRAGKIHWARCATATAALLLWIVVIFIVDSGDIRLSAAYWAAITAVVH